MSEVTKPKKFYRIKEKVWLKTVQKPGVVLSLDIPAKKAIASYFNDNDELVKDEFMFWDLDKFRKPEKVTEIPVKYFTELDPYVEGQEGFYSLEEIKVGNWIDLRASEDTTMKAFEHKPIPLGVAMQLPEGHEGWVVPRSSTYKKWGIIQANHLGIIDEVYCGDNDQWFLSAIALRDTFIKRGSRICQFRTMSIMGSVEFKTVDKLGNPDRGGFGSTG